MLTYQFNLLNWIPEKIISKEPNRKNKVMLSENIKTPIIVAKITLKKSKGITIVDLAARNPLIVKNWANNPKIEAKKILNIDFSEGKIAKWKYGKNRNMQLYKANQNCIFSVFSYATIFFINILTKAIKNAPNKA